jgi:putative transposase
MARHSDTQLTLGSSITRVRRRKRAGRPAIHDKSIRHRTREGFASRFPLHVSIRIEKRAVNLRKKEPFRIVKRALQAASAVANARICDYSVQGNHLHLLVEAGDRRALSRAMRSLNIRIGKNLNRMMNSHGRVIAHRYHCHVLRTPTEVRRARSYVQRNTHHHRGGDPHLRDPYAARVVAAQTWLLTEGWRRGKPSSDDPSRYD